MYNVVKEISKKKNLDKNLKTFGNYMSDMYYRFAKVCLSMNYFTYFQMMEDLDKEKNKDIAVIHEKLNEIIKNYISGNQNISEDTKALYDIRNNIISTMKVLTSYADIFDRYEYVLNRVEYRFKENDILDSNDDREFTRKIMQYIVADEDSAAINMKISEIIGELPVRMTKAKFFERLDEGINVYRDTDRKSLTDFLYMVGTSAMMDLPDGFEDRFPDLYSIYTSVSEADYDNITEEQYDSLHSKIVYAAQFIQDSVNIYMMLQQIVNEVCAIVDLSEYTTDKGEEAVSCEKLIDYVNKAFFSGKFDAADSELEECFMRIEGVQEMLHEKYMTFEYQLDELKKENINDECKDMYDKLFKAEVLVSDSLFVEFNDYNTSDGEKLSDDEFGRIKKEFMEKTDMFLSDKSRPVKRAVMAVIIASLPTFFNNLEELQEHIYSSLESCRDKAEKAAVIEVINMIISE